MDTLFPVIQNGNDISIANPKGRKIRQTLKSIGKKKSSKKHDRKDECDTY